MSNLIGNAPYQVPTNADLGDLAYQDSDYAVVGNLNIDTTLAVGSNATIGANATITGTTTIGGNATIGGNVFLSQAYSPLSTSPNVVVAKGYVDTQSIIWGM
jgi:acetyltransferase-like isoleucine patch superfamily enzyme